MAIILEHEGNLLYFKYLWVIVLNAHKQGTHVTIFDCDWDYYEYTNKNHDQERKQIISRVRDQFLQMLSTFTNNKVKTIKVNANEIWIDKRKILSINNFLVADSIHYQFGNSLRSMFARNYFPTSNLTLKGSRMRKQFRIYVQLFLTFRQLCQDILGTGSFDLILIPNGRSPNQTAQRVTAEELGIDFYFYEHAMPRGERFHFGNFQTQEFSKMQEFIKSQITESTKDSLEEVNDFSKNWFEQQENNIRQNPFITVDTQPSKIGALRRSKPLAVFFNSSIDERYSNLGADLNGWESQKHAISSIANRLKEQGFEVLVRIHPNTANKSWWDLINLISYLEKMQISYVLPWNSPSSYSLLREAKIVLTWGSTISMEAISRGIPTVVFGRTMYDDIAGATIITPTSLAEIDFTKIECLNPNFGFLAAYFNKHWGYKLKDYCDASDLELIEAIVGNITKDHLPATILTKKKSHGTKTVHSISRFIILLRRIRKGRYSTPNDFRKLLLFFLDEKSVNRLTDFLTRISVKTGLLRGDGDVSI